MKSDLYSAGKDNGNAIRVLDVEPKGVMVTENDTVHCYKTVTFT